MRDYFDEAPSPGPRQCNEYIKGRRIFAVHFSYTRCIAQIRTYHIFYICIYIEENRGFPGFNIIWRIMRHLGSHYYTVQKMSHYPSNNNYIYITIPRSLVQLSERIQRVSTSWPGCQLRTPPETSRKSQHYGTERFKLGHIIPKT